MAIVVQKFGGTSVATPEAREALLSQVKKCKVEGNEVVLVVSAMGRTGDPYATDTLINLLEQIDPKIKPRKKDLIMSCGEIISCSLISHFLESNGIPSEPMTGFQAGILTNGQHTSSDIINIDTTKIKRFLKEGKVVVIAGFQGTTEDNEVTTLGRGGSDTSAVAIGGYLGAERVDIFTDVIGIAEVDPRVVPEAKYMTMVSNEDMYKLAEQGAKVIHPRAVSTAKQFGISLRVRSTFSEELGTLIKDGEVKYDHKIIGMALEKGLHKQYFIPTDNSLGKIFMLYNEKEKELIVKGLEDFLSMSGIEVKEITWGCNEVTILLSEEKLVEAVQGLYKYFH